MFFLKSQILFTLLIKNIFLTFLSGYIITQKEVQKCMDFKMAKGVIEDLSHSQGFYGRLLEQLNNFTEEQKTEFENILKENEVKTSLDLIFLLEC